MTSLHDTMTKLFSEHQDSSLGSDQGLQKMLKLSLDEISTNQFYLNGVALEKDYVVP